MPRDDIILWLDLETTGNKDDALILEVGIVATGPGPEFPVKEAFLGIINHKVPLFPLMDDVVLSMHQKNGLLDDINLIGQSPEVVASRLETWLDHILGGSSEHVVLAGSGIAHFDRKYIRRDWLWFDTRLAYYMYDIGVLRRMLRMVGIESETDQSQTPHRALDDVFQHIRETRQLLRKVGKR